MLELIVGNLLNNAIKYTPAGGYVRTKISLRNQDEVWLRRTRHRRRHPRRQARGRSLTASTRSRTHWSANMKVWV